MRALKLSKTITEWWSESVNKYLNDIGKIPLLTTEEEVDLCNRIRTWDKDALQKLTQANLRFVVSTAKQYQNHWLPLSDLISEWNLWLIKAAKLFDVSKWFKFISYAVWWIRQSVLQALADHPRAVRLPWSKVNTLRKIKKARDYREQQLDREPTASEIAQVLDVSEKEISSSLVLEYHTVSFDASTPEDENTTFIDIFDDSNQVPLDNSFAYQESLRRDIARALNALSPTQVEVIKLYYGIEVEHNLQLDDIAKHMGVTRERIRQIKDRAVARLRTVSKSLALENYLGKQ